MNPSSLESLYALLEAYDNSHEPRPLFNYRSNAFAVIITFMITATIGSIAVLLSFKNGFGEHILTIGVDNIVLFQMKFYTSLVSFTISTTLMKLTLLTQYLRVFGKGTQTRKVVWGMIIFVTLWGVAFSFCAIAPCFPVTGFWNWTAPAVCYGFGSKAPSEIAGTFIAHGITNAITDLIVLSIPVPLCMWDLIFLRSPIQKYFRKSSDTKQQVAVGTLFCLGLSINVINIWRVQTVVLHQAGTYPVLDPTWYGPISIILGVIEIELASICASIPVFWPVITESIGKIFVTQEVHVTHQHRRLSGDDDDRYELQQTSTSPSQHSRVGSEVSLKLVLTGTKSQVRDHYQDSYVKNSVLPLGVSDKEATSEAQIMSEGRQGYERNQKGGFFGMSRTSHDTVRDQDGSIHLSKKLSQKKLQTFQNILKGTQTRRIAIIAGMNIGRRSVPPFIILGGINAQQQQFPDTDEQPDEEEYFITPSNDRTSTSIGLKWLYEVSIRRTTPEALRNEGNWSWMAVIGHNQSSRNPWQTRLELRAHIIFLSSQTYTTPSNRSTLGHFSYLKRAFQYWFPGCCSGRALRGQNNYHPSSRLIVPALVS
ncbi:hypothetical protein F5X96DRAFT_667179 [Biscogniauxia mediterranea]|nr:hypothetical protein F5X96DRAFT_667179 [Biscogniauxia mediterranea]